MEKFIFQHCLTRRVFMRVFSFCLVSVFLMAFNVNVDAQKPNFSGTWTFNQQKSELGQVAQGGQRGFGMGGGTLNITQSGNTLTIDRVFERQGEKRTTTTKYTLDGKESVNSTGRGSSKSTAVWSSDNKSLTISTTRSFEFNDQRRESKSVEVWTLADGGKSLVINSTRSIQQGGERKSKLVYDKK